MWRGPRRAARVRMCGGRQIAHNTVWCKDGIVQIRTQQDAARRSMGMWQQDKSQEGRRSPIHPSPLIVVLVSLSTTYVHFNTCRSGDGAGKGPVGNVGSKTRLSGHPAGLQPNRGSWDPKWCRRHTGLQRRVQQVSLPGVGLVCCPFDQ